MEEPKNRRNPKEEEGRRIRPPATSSSTLRLFGRHGNDGSGSAFETKGNFANNDKKVIYLEREKKPP